MQIQKEINDVIVSIDLNNCICDTNSNISSAKFTYNNKNSSVKTVKSKVESNKKYRRKLNNLI